MSAPCVTILGANGERFSCQEYEAETGKFVLRPERDFTFRAVEYRRRAVFEKEPDPVRSRHTFTLTEVTRADTLKVRILTKTQGQEYLLVPADLR